MLCRGEINRVSTKHGRFLYFILRMFNFASTPARKGITPIQLLILPSYVGA